MSILKRVVEVTQAKVNALLNRIEDPNEILDLSYEKMLTGLQEVKAHLADIVTEQKRIEAKMDQANTTIQQRDAEARAALQLKREDLAKAALELKQQEKDHLNSLQSHHQAVTAQVEKLKIAESKYQHRIEAFRDQKELAKSTYSAASAQVKINESMTGVNQKLGNVGDTLQRAQDKIDTMQARAAAIDSLTEEGILNNGDSKNNITRELEKIQSQSLVEDELAKLKKELNQG